MNNTKEYLNTFSPLISAIAPMIVTWVGKHLNAKRNIYARHNYLFCNYAMYKKIMIRIIIDILSLGIITVMSMAIGDFLKVFPFGLIEWFGIYTISYILQIIIIGKGYYGLDKYGNRKNVSVKSDALDS